MLQPGSHVLLEALRLLDQSKELGGVALGARVPSGRGELRRVRQLPADRDRQPVLALIVTGRLTECADEGDDELGISASERTTLGRRRTAIAS